MCFWTLEVERLPLKLLYQIQNVKIIEYKVVPSSCSFAHFILSGSKPLEKVSFNQSTSLLLSKVVKIRFDGLKNICLLQLHILRPASSRSPNGQNYHNEQL